MAENHDLQVFLYHSLSEIEKYNLQTIVDVVDNKQITDKSSKIVKNTRFSNSGQLIFGQIGHIYIFKEKLMRQVFLAKNLDLYIFILHNN